MWLLDDILATESVTSICICFLLPPVSLTSQAYNYSQGSIGIVYMHG
jgi:hypothetical protein